MCAFAANPVDGVEYAGVPQQDRAGRRQRHGCRDDEQGSLPSLGLIERGTGSQGIRDHETGGVVWFKPAPPGGAPRRADGDAAVLHSAQ